MSDVRLLPCPSCARHVRASEGACPFCAAALPASFRAAPLPRSPAGRLKRAALFALGTSAAAVAACGGDTEKPNDGLISAPVYGGPPVEDGGPTADAAKDAPFLVDAAYGGPPQDAASDAPDDAAEKDGSARPLYGAPPP